MDMIAPLAKQEFFGPELYMLLGFLIGIGFGVSLEIAGFGNSRKLTAQFYLHDMAVYKVMFTAVVTSMFLTTAAAAVGLLDFHQLFIPATFLWPQIIGGLLLGVGFVAGGYCPGTSVVSVASGKIDGMVYVAGFYVGLLVFPWLYEPLLPLYNAGSMGVITLFDYVPLPPAVLALIFVAVAIASFFGVARLERWAKARWPMLHY